jgi:hypothetical protein
LFASPQTARPQLWDRLVVDHRAHRARREDVDLLRVDHAWIDRGRSVPRDDRHDGILGQVGDHELGACLVEEPAEPAARAAKPLHRDAQPGGVVPPEDVLRHRADPRESASPCTRTG